MCQGWEDGSQSWISAHPDQSLFDWLENAGEHLLLAVLENHFVVYVHGSFAMSFHCVEPFPPAPDSGGRSMALMLARRLLPAARVSKQDMVGHIEVRDS